MNREIPGSKAVNRDDLARMRTLLANERTLLAYIRTGLAWGGIAAFIFKFFASTLALTLSGLLLFLALFTFTWGWLRFRGLQKML